MMINLLQVSMKSVLSVKRNHSTWNMY